MAPSKIKGINSKKIQGLLYSTKNRTECSLPYGSMDRTTKAAIKAQKNERQSVFIGK